MVEGVVDVRTKVDVCVEESHVVDGGYVDVEVWSWLFDVVLF